MDTQIFLASALEKVFLNRKPTAMENGTKVTTWRGAHAGVQVVFYLPDDETRRAFGPTYAIDVKGLPQGVTVAMYEVKSVPAELACFSFAKADPNYLSHEPGLYPDALPKAKKPQVRTLAGQYRAMWLRFDADENVQPEVAIGIMLEEGYGASRLIREILLAWEETVR